MLVTKVTYGSKESQKAHVDTSPSLNAARTKRLQVIRGIFYITVGHWTSALPLPSIRLAQGKLNQQKKWKQQQTEFCNICLLSPFFQ